ncbi:hypothetical protein CHU92_13975 [Flavobacterium cyanobacteriorum]|uniref:Peptidase S8/S53 domain-containing protein n=1 Tax=Flavobacterium cyanobacteriorum TaxID=2022802 RepID=A0A255YWF9_9FLAO|nr:S8 family serine peptidase [Flavobacterium cyanobacteriorum]OYQ33024.1 hypothetical protein CHU92_13975 [Flavobacterium cyanobacteriorum]
MKKSLLIFYSLFFLSAYSQKQERPIYSFYVHINSYSNAPKFEQVGNKLIYSGTNLEEKDFFSKYEILQFEQSFPASKRINTLNVFSVVSYNSSLLQDMKKKFDKYLIFEETTGNKIELLNSYPNDYGSTSPVINLGANASRKDLDYINAPKAWDITTGSNQIKIGISDSNIDTTDVDLQLKTQRLFPLRNIYTNPAYFDVNNTGSWHGTSTASLAAAQGNNGAGTVGVCYDCSIVANSYTYFYNHQGQSYNMLLQLAQSGVKVINMSWAIMLVSEGYTAEQWIIDEITEDYNVVMVAGAGNRTSFATTNSNHSGAGGGYYTGIQYGYPASYDKVISVSGINHTYSQMTDTGAYCCTSDWFPNYVNIEDSVSPVVDGTDIQNPIGVTHNGYYQSPTNTNGLVWMHTLNKHVDILAPSYKIFQAPWYSHNLTEVYGSGTSSAAPLVTGTVGLMVSVDQCLNYKEVEDILQLTTKDVEHMPINQNFYGIVGAGKLETGDAVEFVAEMISPTGSAVIDNHIFYRFNFELNRINNRLSIQNVVFKDKCTADFTARNIVDVLPGSDLAPNAEGFIDLKIDANLDIGCSNTSRIAAREKEKVSKNVNAIAETKLFPNPNNGIFNITLANKHNSVNIQVFDISGKLIYENKATGASFSISLPGIAPGIYLVKLSSDTYSETIKFVKK